VVGNPLRRETQFVRVRYGPSALAAFAGVSFFLALIQFFLIALGLLEISLNRLLATFVVILFIVLALSFSTLFFELKTMECVRVSARRWASRALDCLFSSFTIIAIGWAAFVWLQLWWLAFLRPPYDWDGLYYHIPAVHEWVMAGRVSWISDLPDIPFVSFPMAIELSGFFTHFLLGTSRIINAYNLPYWLLAFFALVVIAKRFGARSTWAWIAGALIVGAPVFVSQSVSGYVDPGFTSAVMAAIAASCVFVFDRGRPAWRNAVLLGITVGLTLGSKGTGLPFACIFVVAVVVGGLLVREDNRWSYWLKYVALAMLVMFLIGGYWYVRNALITGNPIYPIQLKLGHKILIEGWDYVQFNNACLPPWLEQYPSSLRTFVSWLQLDAPISGYAPTGGMGYIWIAGAIPAMLILWLRVARKRYPGSTREFVFLTILTLLLLLVQPATWWARFTVWMHALGLPSIAVLLGDYSRPHHPYRLRLVALVLSISLLSLVIWESNRTLALEWKDGRMTGPIGTHERFVSSVDYMFPGMSETTGFSEFFEVSKIARTPWERYGTLLGGILAMPLDKREIIVLPMQPERENIDQLRVIGVEWILWDAIMAGEISDSIKSFVEEEYVYNPSPDVEFHLLRLKP
jgi:hypothetical protein